MLKVHLASALIPCLIAGTSAAEPLPRGVFAVDASVQIPNVAGPSWRSTRYICLDPGAGDGHLPMPVLSPNNPFASCEARDIERTEERLRYRIVCAGRDSARALASYVLSGDGFRGEIAMVLGGKNMTLTEHQVGHRLGDCSANAATAEP